MSSQALKQLDTVFAERAAKARREQMRWLCLVYLDVARPSTMLDGALLPAMHSDFPEVGPNELRRQLDYLEARGLVQVTKLVDERWSLKLTYAGIDLVEYTSDSLPGIARPHHGN